MSDLQNQAILTNHQANQFAQIDGADIATFRFLTQDTKEVQNGNSILLPKAVLPIVLTGCTDQISLEAAVIFLKPASFIASYLRLDDAENRLKQVARVLQKTILPAINKNKKLEVSYTHQDVQNIATKSPQGDVIFSAFGRRDSSSDPMKV
ncbi:MAG: hypothetical protein Q9192_003748 [Flavoplaca navasiana]